MMGEKVEQIIVLQFYKKMWFMAPMKSQNFEKNLAKKSSNWVKFWKKILKIVKN